MEWDIISNGDLPKHKIFVLFWICDCVHPHVGYYSDIAGTFQSTTGGTYPVPCVECWAYCPARPF
jgi:hypothetical protein